jgi:hypothetical protein
MRMPQLPPDFAAITPPAALPVLPFWQARSFWLMLLAVLAPIISALGFDWPWVTNPATVDLIMQAVGAIAAAGAWQARLAPHFRLGLK